MKVPLPFSELYSVCVWLCVFKHIFKGRWQRSLSCVEKWNWATFHEASDTGLENISPVLRASENQRRQERTNPHFTENYCLRTSKLCAIFVCLFVCPLTFLQFTNFTIYQSLSGVRIHIRDRHTTYMFTENNAVNSKALSIKPWSVLIWGFKGHGSPSVCLAPRE